MQLSGESNKRERKTKIQEREKLLFFLGGLVRVRLEERSEYEGSSRKSCRTQGMKSAGRSTGAE